MADRIIDLGPEGGDKRGEIVAIGTPEQVVEMPRNYTGGISSLCWEVKAKGWRRSDKDHKWISEL